MLRMTYALEYHWHFIQQRSQITVGGNLIATKGKVSADYKKILSFSEIRKIRMDTPFIKSELSQHNIS